MDSYGHEQEYLDSVADLKTQTVHLLRMMGIDPYQCDDTKVIDTTLGSIKDLPPRKQFCESDGPHIPIDSGFSRVALPKKQPK